MIKSLLLTGDTHGRVIERLTQIPEELRTKEHALVILGDSGLNFWMNNHDNSNKRRINENYDCRIYCVRGNHEARPCHIKDIVHEYDEDVGGMVWLQPQFPKIRYFDDFGVYCLNGYKTLVIGGAYSIDKDYRLLRNVPWFEDEQLSEEEKKQAEQLIEATGREYDIVLTHTCPVSWEPTDLFIKGVNQAKVDKTTEVWLENIKNSIEFKLWCFAHFHDDRIVRPGVEMFNTDYQEIETLMRRWEKPDELDWWLEKDPNYYMGR